MIEFELKNSYDIPIDLQLNAVKQYLTGEMSIKETVESVKQNVEKNKGGALKPEEVKILTAVLITNKLGIKHEFGPLVASILQGQLLGDKFDEKMIMNNLVIGGIRDKSGAERIIREVRSEYKEAEVAGSPLELEEIIKAKKNRAKRNNSWAVWRI